MLGGEAIGGSDAHAQTAVHQQGLPTPATPSEIGEMPDVGPAEREGVTALYDRGSNFRLKLFSECRGSLTQNRRKKNK